MREDSREKVFIEREAGRRHYQEEFLKEGINRN